MNPNIKDWSRAGGLAAGKKPKSFLSARGRKGAEARWAKKRLSESMVYRENLEKLYQEL